MTKEPKPTHEKDQIKVLAREKGGLAKAENKRNGSHTSEQSAKRKNTHH